MGGGCRSLIQQKGLRNCEGLLFTAISIFQSYLNQSS